MSDFLVIQLPDGVSREHPEAKRLLAEAATIVPLPPGPTTHEILAAQLRAAQRRYCGLAAALFADASQSEKDAYVVLAEAALTFFRGVLNDVLKELPGRPVPGFPRSHRTDGAMDMLYRIEKAISK